jgi:hypothetical protein
MAVKCEQAAELSQGNCLQRCFRSFEYNLVSNLVEDAAVAVLKYRPETIAFSGLGCRAGLFKVVQRVLDIYHRKLC